MSAEQVAAAVVADLDRTGPTIEVRDRVVPVEDLAGMPPPEWLVTDYFVTGSLAVMFGKPGAGKTFVALDVAASVASGRDWLGRIVKQANVLYIAGEGTSGFWPRTRAWKAAHGLVSPLDGLWVHPGPVPFLNVAYVDALARVAVELDCRLVIVDTLNRMTAGANENDSATMGSFVSACAAIQQAAGATVLVVHHDSRAGGAPRGHSSLDGAADTIVEIAADDPAIRIRVVKQKDANEAEDVHVQLVRHDDSCALALYRPSTGVSAAAVEMLRVLDEIAGPEGVAAGVWSKACDGVAVRTFWRWANRLSELDYCQATATGRTTRYRLTDLGRQAIAPQPLPPLP